jgi:hypothetical protein
MKRLLAIVIVFSSTLAAQVAGVLPDWEVRETAAALDKHAQTVDNLLAQLRPAEWTANGAPELYQDQIKQARLFNSYLSQEARALGERPEKLSLALDTFFRLDHLHALLESVTAGVRSYQNSALADLLAAAVSKNAATRERLKEYTRQLAVEREQEWEIAHREAQRCRESLAKQPPNRKPVPAKP